MIKPAELEKLSTEVSEHLFGHYLPFWCGPALDRENGGWMAWLSNDLKPDRAQPKGAYREQPDFMGVFRCSSRPSGAGLF